MKDKIQEFSDSHETSIEIARAIFMCADHTGRTEQEIWADPTFEERMYVLELAFTDTDDDELFWGESTLNRADWKIS